MMDQNARSLENHPDESRSGSDEVKAREGPPDYSLGGSPEWLGEDARKNVVPGIIAGGDLTVENKLGVKYTTKPEATSTTCHLLADSGKVTDLGMKTKGDTKGTLDFIPKEATGLPVSDSLNIGSTMETNKHLYPQNEFALDLAAAQPLQVGRHVSKHMAKPEDTKATVNGGEKADLIMYEESKPPSPARPTDIAVQPDADADFTPLEKGRAYKSTEISQKQRKREREK